MNNVHPILYSFRRCPYAMRARMGLAGAQIIYEHREIILRNKPEHMLKISPKGTVPVLMIPTGEIIDESLDIMLWALKQNDPHKWLHNLQEHSIDLINRNDTTFKALLDRYKYPNRFPDEDCRNARNDAMSIIEDLETRIQKNGSIHSNKTTIADIAIFPFIRQFAHVDRDWFYDQNLPSTHEWLNTHLESELFKNTMSKHPLWEE